MAKVLLVGLVPEVVDFAKFPGLTVERLAAALAAQEAALRERGVDARWCLVDLGATAEAVVRAELEGVPHDVVLVGAGVRTVPEYLMLFERLVNVIHEHAPGAKICFNTRPDDTVEAVLRWLV
ncbi:MAG: hypothetical protein KF773_27425 [Deltaproteobacteria bacterium]|nr:hypothetical protein [Deltaproteobacteria bacterium]